jgi:hypothetical protein
VYCLAEQGTTEKIGILGIISTFIFIFLEVFKNMKSKEMVIMKNFYIQQNPIVSILSTISGNISAGALLSNALYFSSF